MGVLLSIIDRVNEKKSRDSFIKLLKIQDGMVKGRWVPIGHGFIPCDEYGNELSPDDINIDDYRDEFYDRVE